MKLPLFNKKKANVKKAPDKSAPEIVTEENHEKASKEEKSAHVTRGVDIVDGHRILKQFYVSEKGTAMGEVNQYVFVVYPSATKSEIKKHVSGIFSVAVTKVRIVNMPHKRRDIGKHPGERAGFKKAIVTLKEGDVIEQAKP